MDRDSYIRVLFVVYRGHFLFSSFHFLSWQAKFRVFVARALCPAEPGLPKTLRNF